MLPYESRVTDEKTRKLIDELANECNDSEIAHILNERGLVTGVGSRFDSDSVRWVRNVQQFRSYKQRLQDAGWLTATEMCKRLRKGRTTIRRMHLKGRIQARLCTNHGQWLYWPPDLPLPAPEGSKTPQMDTPDGKGAV